jgi:hypothetical protein
MQMERAGYRLKGNVFTKGWEVYLPLYEAKMIWHFDHRFASMIGDEQDHSDRPSRKY